MAESQAGTSFKVKKTIVLVGMMGAGKTAVGRLLAERLSVVFRDSDQEIEAASNQSVAEIFARDGEPFFRQKETQVIQRLLGGMPSVLSTGGGAFLAEGNRSMISSQGVSIWLDADLDVLWNRVKNKDTRPLLKTPDPYGTLKALYEARVPIYAQADLRVPSVPSGTIEATVSRVCDALLQQRSDVLETQG